jgi:hypothetical protein
VKSKLYPDKEEGEVKRFIGGTEHVCPFGALAERHGKVSYMRARNPDFSLTSDVGDFVKSDQQALVILLPKGSGSLEEARHRTDQYFLVIARVLLKLQFPKTSPQESDRIIRAQFLPYMGKDSLQEVFLSFRGQALYLIYMGPEYEPNEAGVPHARYAPHPMLVMTRHKDVYDATKEHPMVFAEVRRRMREAMGGVYDASARFLDQKPEIVEP